MKLNPDTNIPRFLQTVQSCKGDVHYLTPEGDDLNLKSALTQFLFAAVVAGQMKELPGEISFQDPEDQSALQRYLL